MLALNLCLSCSVYRSKNLIESLFKCAYACLLFMWVESSKFLKMVICSTFFVLIILQNSTYKFERQIAKKLSKVISGPASLACRKNLTESLLNCADSQLEVG